MRRHPRISAVSAGTLAVLLIIVASPAGLTAKQAHGIVVPPATPSWVLPGQYVEYNQTYIIDGVTASVAIKDAFLNSSGQMRIQKLDPHVAPGFSMADLVSPYDSNYQPQATVVSTANGTRSTTTLPNVGSIDPSVFVDAPELEYTNPTVVSLHLSGPAGPAIQAWKVNETALNIWIYGMLGESKAIVNASFVWFDKDLSVKVRESTNYTNPVLHHHIVSVEKLEDTNIPQLESVLMPLGSTTAASASASATSGAPQSTDALEWSALPAAIVVAIVATAFYFTRKKLSASSDAVPGRTLP
jgi:hypothetical protein